MGARPPVNRENRLMRGGRLFPKFARADLEPIRGLPLRLRDQRRVFIAGHFDALIAVLVRSLNPHERLNVDHVSRTKVTEIAADGCRELQKPTIGFPRRPRLIAKIEVI